MSSESLNAQAAALAAQARQAVLAGCRWLCAEEVASRAGVQCVAVAAWRNARKVFSIRVQGSERFPDYAFGPDGRPLPAIADVIRTLEGRSGDFLAGWFESTSRFLAGARPRELVRDDPDRVLAAAKNLVDWETYGG